MAGTVSNLLGFRIVLDIPKNVNGTKQVMKPELPDTAEFSQQAKAQMNLQLFYSRRLRYPLELENKAGIRFRFIPSGDFEMGTDKVTNPSYNYSKYMHPVSVKQFYIATTELSYKQYYTVLNQTDKITESNKNKPVNSISWREAQAFIQALNTFESVPQGTYRLPTEVEWEYVCKSGEKKSHFFSPSKVKEYAHLNAIESEDVAKRKANPYGIFNLYGNVMEWCQNDFYNYKTGENFSTGTKSIRGGHYQQSLEEVAAAARTHKAPDLKSSTIGFRVVMTIPQKTTKETSK